MSLDDFIVPHSVGSPTGLSPPLSTDHLSSDHAVAPAIAIKRDSKGAADDLLSRSAAASVPPHALRQDEFDYVQKHVRKTSIDERRVSFLVGLGERSPR